MLRTRNGKVVVLIAFIFILILLAVLFINFLRSSPSDQAMDTVIAFYTYEQEGNFAESWEIFHPFMKEKFTKGRYLEQRTHVFMNHFGVETFTFTTGKVETIEDWVMEEGREPIELVYTVPVHQQFSGTFGNFTITQQVYVTEIDGEWNVLWDYKK